MTRAARAGTRVVVKRGRHGLEMRVNGTLASLQRPGGGVTGTVWWALAAPVVLLRERPRVLLLGLAGGSVGQAVRTLSPRAELVGVDCDRAVLRAARRHFGMDALGIEVVADDALRYLRRERRRFDLIVEDLFVGGLRTVHKPEGLLEEGYPLIRERLRPQGFVTSNTIHETPAVARAMLGWGGAVLSMAVRGHWNHILFWGRALPEARAWRAVMEGFPALARVLPRLGMRRLADQ